MLIINFAMTRMESVMYLKPPLRAQVRLTPSMWTRSQNRKYHAITVRCIRCIWMATMVVVMYVNWSNLRSLTVQSTSIRKMEGIVAAPATQAERTKLQLEILEDAKYGTLKWPRYMKLHHIPSNVQETSNSDADGVVHSCIATAYFRIDSKHDSSKYDIWMKNMLSLHDCMVIFCESDMVETMIQQREKSRGLTAIIEMQLGDLPISKYNYFPTANTATEFWKYQLEIDPEKEIHRGYEVFWIWLSKSWFVSTAALLQHHLFAGTNKNHDVMTINTWMWADIGSFREKQYKNITVLRYVDDKEIFPDSDSVLWVAHRKPDPPSDPFFNRKQDPKESHHFYHGGSHAIAKSVTAWMNYHEEFVHTLDDYAAKGLFLGEDQCVLQTTCLLYPKSCAYVPSDQVNDNKYRALRHVLRYGPDDGKKWNLPPFQLWHPPSLQESPA